jgi:DNA replication licensing factor MCM3
VNELVLENERRNTIVMCMLMPCLPLLLHRISMAELRSQDPRLSQRLRMDPLRHIRALEAACDALASEERPGYDKDGVKIKVALAGPVGAAPSSPRGLTSSSLRQLVCVEGVATKVCLNMHVLNDIILCLLTRRHDR